jgi:hypothetical protein
MITLKHFKIPLAELVFLIGLLWFALTLDTVFTVSLFWQFNLVAVFLILLITLPRFLLTQQKETLWSFLIFAVLLFSLRFIDLTPRKPFMRFYHNITIGMQVDQVQSLFNQHFPLDGKFRQPAWGFGDGSPVTPYDNDPQLADRPNQSLHYTLDPNDGRFNSEWLVVYFKDGQVVGTEYLPD